MKKFFTITLLALLTVGLFVSCDADLEEPSGFCFTALTDNSEVTLKISYAPDPYHDLPQVNLLYSRDNSEWKSYTPETSIPLAKANDKVYFKAKEKVSRVNGYYEYYHFTTVKGQVSVKGNVMYLINPSGESVEMAEYAFERLFYGNTGLVSAKDLLLPATGLVKGCYFEMFRGCSALTDCPELKATVLADDCYHAMFFGCSKLTKAPELPATNLTAHCYESMFSDCTSLTAAPVLPATTLADYCYQNMFLGCSALKSVTMLATDISATSCLTGWLSGVASTGNLKVANEEIKGTLDNNTYRPSSGWTVSVYE